MALGAGPSNRPQASRAEKDGEGCTRLAAGQVRGCLTSVPRFVEPLDYSELDPRIALWHPLKTKAAVDSRRPVLSAQTVQKATILHAQAGVIRTYGAAADALWTEIDERPDNSTGATRSDTGGSMNALSDSANVLKFVWGHPANEGARCRALVRAGLFQVSGRLLGRRTVTRLGQQSRIWADLHRTGASKAVYANPPDHPEMLVWQQVLRPGALFVDVGANVGSYTIWAADLGADVIALEPAEDTYSLLLENVALNAYPITTIKAAAGPSCGSVRFTDGYDTINRMDPEGAVETTMVTIDSIIGSRTVAGMKVDVEGFEIDVLRGCGQALAEHRIELMQLEWNAASESAVGADRRPVADFLHGYGYELFRPDQTGVLVPLADLNFGADVFALPQG
jgi:FkbM family methyltransferase